MIDFVTQIHSQIQQGKEKYLYSSTKLLNNFLAAYTRCNSLPAARQLFTTMRTNGKADVFSWTTLISGYAQHDQPAETIELFREIQQEKLVLPNVNTYSSVLTACANVGNLQLGKQIHSELLRHSHQWNTIVETSLLNMYAKCNVLTEARKLFDSMRQRGVANMISWTNMISGYTQNKQANEAVKLLFEMQQEVAQPEIDPVVYGSMVAALREVRLCYLFHHI